ncbi:unnamed protein product [Microthlaspi erraticum]|uniref:Uncharacterized protein n=1 Tax=Microthlaspi erraticum TaxID=1685480 RepID=A0A6D2L555_9BRAS|nr:unnamed protein product [Microthlaspi erraticum]
MPPKTIVKQEKGKAVDLGGDGKFTSHAETTLDAESLDTFRQDFRIPDGIELVLPAEGEDPEHRSLISKMAFPADAPELRPPRDRMRGSSSGRGRLVRCSRSEEALLGEEQHQASRVVLLLAEAESANIHEHLVEG